MKELKFQFEDQVWESLQLEASQCGQSVEQIVSKAVERYLQADVSTLYQISTSTALTEGVIDGAIAIRSVRQHGDLGLGTFDGLDGEMIVVDGKFYHAKSDGSVTVAGDDAVTPFACVTKFVSQSTCLMDSCHSLAVLEKRLDDERRTENAFYAVRVNGFFKYIKTRALCRVEPGVRLVDAASTQAEFEFESVNGTLVGFWSPEYAKTLNVPGYHLHFLSDDCSKGGHLLALEGNNLEIGIQEKATLTVVLPQSMSFLNADLTHDPSEDLSKAEKNQN